MTDAQFRAARENPETFVEAIIKRRAGLPLQQNEIGVLLGCSRGMVASIERRAIEKIRAVAVADGICDRRAG